MILWSNNENKDQLAQMENKFLILPVQEYHIPLLSTFTEIYAYCGQTSTLPENSLGKAQGFQRLDAQ